MKQYETLIIGGGGMGRCSCFDATSSPASDEPALGTATSGNRCRSHNSVQRASNSASNWRPAWVANARFACLAVIGSR